MTLRKNFSDREPFVQLETNRRIETHRAVHEINDG